MFQKIKTFWNNFWLAIKTAYNKAFKEVPKERTQEYRDTKRINFLARKSKAEGLTDEEKAEQALLRQEYVAEIRASFSATLDSTVILNPDGTKIPLKSKKDQK